MKRIALGMALVCAASWAWGGELGSRFEVGDRIGAVGWLHLSGAVGPVNLSGRVEGDLLCLCLRRLQLGASTTWGEVSAGAEAAALSTGRMDASLTGSWKPLWRTDLGLLSSQLGGKATVVDLLGGRFPTAAGWAFVRLDRDHWWIEGNGNVAWPGGNPFAELRLGVTGSRWASLSLSTSGAGIEMGAEAGGLFIQSSFSLGSALQTVTIGAKAEGVRVQARMVVRASALASSSFTLTVTQTPWSGSVLLAFSGLGLDKVTAEVRYGLGK